MSIWNIDEIPIFPYVDVNCGSRDYTTAHINLDDGDSSSNSFWILTHLRFGFKAA